MWDQHELKGAFKLGVFTPKTYTLKSLLGPLPPDSGTTPKNNFLYETLLMKYTIPMTSHSCFKHIQQIALQFNTGS